MKNTIIVIWVVAVTALSVMPYPEKGTLSFQLSESGMIMHFAAYFAGTALFFLTFRKNTLFFVLSTSFTIFLYSVALEFIQLYLPYRTFNPVDIAANAFGIAFFSLVWTVFWKKRRDLEIRENFLEKENRSADPPDIARKRRAG